MKLIGILFAVVLGCSPLRGESAKSIDTWERQKECFAAAREHWRDVAAAYKDDFFADWSAHYSPKYGRCYMQILVTKMDSKGSSKFEILRDVFEHRTVADFFDRMENDGPGKTSPRIDMQPVTVNEFVQFARDHMEN